MKKLFALCFSLFCLVFGMTEVNRAQPTFASDLTPVVAERVTRDTPTSDQRYEAIQNQMTALISSGIQYDKTYSSAEELADGLNQLDVIQGSLIALVNESYTCYSETGESRFLDLHSNLLQTYDYFYDIEAKIREQFIINDYYAKCLDFRFMDGCIDQINRTYKSDTASLSKNKSSVELIISSLKAMKDAVNNAVLLLGEHDAYSALLISIDNEIALAEALLTNINKQIDDVNAANFESKVTLFVDQGSSLNARVDDISSNFKNNNLNYKGDVEECENLTSEINKLIAKIDEDTTINSDDRIKALRSKLAENLDNVSSAKENIEKDHKVFLAIVIACPIVFVVAALLLLYFFGFKKRFFRKAI